MTTDNAQIEGNVYPIIPKVPGYVSNVLVNDNQDVQKGDPLVNLESQDYAIRGAQARAFQEAAIASLISARAQVRQVISESEATRVNFQKSSKDLKRFQQLAENEEVSRQQLEEAERLNSANASKLNALEQQIASTQAQVKLSEAKIAEAKAKLEDSMLQVADTHIVSPVAGKVTKKSVQPGQWVQPGQYLMAIVPLNEIWVIANFKETQLTYMRPGQEVLIKIDSYPGKLFHGKIDSIAPGTGARFSLLPPENATGNFVKVVQRIPVKILINEGDLKGHPETILRPGSNVTASVDVARR